MKGDLLVSHYLRFKDRMDVDVMGKQYFETLVARQIASRCEMSKPPLHYGLIRHEWREGELYSYVMASEDIESTYVTPNPNSVRDDS